MKALDTSATIMAQENFECDYIDRLLRECDEDVMPLPDIDAEPHLLISKVRKHYMEYIVKLLSVNYETNQKLVNKNIYLPSAIWRCAKKIEMSAAQACMIAQIYRKNIVPVVKELKNDTRKGKLNKKLYECLHKPPDNYKKTQTHHFKEKDNVCQCLNVKKKRKVRNSTSPEFRTHENQVNTSCFMDNVYKKNNISNDLPGILPHNMTTSIAQTVNTHVSVFPSNQLPKTQPQLMNLTQNQNRNDNTGTCSPLMPPKRLSTEFQDPDEVMMQLEKLFHEDLQTYDEDIFDKWDIVLEENTKKDGGTNVTQQSAVDNAVIENHAAQIRSLDERLASLTGMLVNNDANANTQKTEIVEKNKKSGSSKWLCEEYFLKQRYFEKLDLIGECNRQRLGRIKTNLIYLFGYDSDDEAILSPLDETPQFIISCKERIAPWVVKLLTPYYIKGHIRGKSIFKALAKHLIRLIYQCSRYPEEYEVNSFITDFLKNHKTIKCEADFKEFKIVNI